MFLSASFKFQKPRLNFESPIFEIQVSQDLKFLVEVEFAHCDLNYVQETISVLRTSVVCDIIYFLLIDRCILGKLTPFSIYIVAHSLYSFLFYYLSFQLLIPNLFKSCSTSRFQLLISKFYACFYIRNRGSFYHMVKSSKLFLF